MILAMTPPDAHLRQEPELLRLLIDNVRDYAIFMLDTSGRVVSWNLGAERIKGYSREEIVGRHFSIFYTPEDRAVGRPNEVLRIAVERDRFEEEGWRVRSDGTRFMASVVINALRTEDGELKGFAKVTRDITQRKREEDSLRRREGQQKTVARLGEFALGETDIQRVFERATAEVARTLDVEMCKVLELLPGEEEVLLRAGVGWQEGLVGKATVSAELESQAGYTLVSSSPVIVSDLREEKRFHGPPLLFNHGVVSGMSCIIAGSGGRPWGVLGAHTKRRVEFTQDDISFLMAVAHILSSAIYRHRTQEQLLARGRELENAAREKDNFMALLGHELRNPLAAIVGALGLVEKQQETATDFPKSDVFAILMRQVRHLATLVDELVDVARISRGLMRIRREAIDLRSSVKHALEVVQPMIEEREHELGVSMPEDAVWVEGDEARLHQVVVNLAKNATLYTPRGGRIDVRVDVEDGQAVLRVRDTGKGIAAEQLPQIYDMFVRIDHEDDSHGGLGVGLSLAKRIVELQEGEIEVFSEGEGKGSEFVVRLPLSSSPKPSARRKAPEPAQSGQRRRIIVVDDNRDAADTICALLRADGHEVTAVYGAHEAIEAAARERPEVMFVDIGLPKMNGNDLCRAIRAEAWGSEIAMAALTGWGQDEDRRQSAEAGFDAHLVKPVDPQRLTEVVEEMAQRSKQCG